ncbi:MAG: GHKL domain-containing protein [Eubacterium sp.]|nr:GHKL domain-containing protein [Eubacterium sp.]
MGLLYLFDVVLNGTFIEWFDSNYITHLKYLDPETQTTQSIPYMSRSSVKRLMMQLMIFGVILLILLAFLVAHFYGRHVRSAIARSKQLLQAETERKNDMIAYLAHDLKTPLTSVVGYLSLLDEASDMPAAQRAKYIHISLEKALRLEKLINEFFEITRYNFSEIVLEKETTDLHYMLVQMSDEFYPVLKEHGNTIKLKCDENVTIYADAAKLARVFNNILKNAIAYSEAGTPILIQTKQTAHDVCISFQNRGKTIPRQKLERIFEKFFRLDDARTSNTGGAGLGLAIAKEIVTQHGGTISADSENGLTTFYVTLPRS